MTSTTVIARMPTWPRRMQDDLAAAYYGVSLSKFRSGVRKGCYPAGVKDGGNVLWYIEDLDSALDALKHPTGYPRLTNGAESWMKSLHHDND